MKILREGSSHVAALNLREQTTLSAQLVTASNPYFKALAMVGLASLAASGIPAGMALGLGAGVMLGNAMKKHLNPENNTESTNYLIAKAFQTPVIREALLFVFKDAGHEKRVKAVKNGRLKKFKEPTADEVLLAKKLHLFGLCVSGMVGSFLGIQGPDDVVRVARRLGAIDELTPLMRVLKDVDGVNEALIAGGGVLASQLQVDKALISLTETLGLSGDNLESGAPGVDRLIEELLDNQVAKAAFEVVDSLHESNTDVQEAMRTDRGGVASYSMYTKDPKVRAFIQSFERISKSLMDKYTDFGPAMFVSLLGLKEEQKQFQMEMNSKSKGHKTPSP